jgi:hypothetical protein
MTIYHPLRFRSPLLTGASCPGINIAMTPELRSALKRHMQWFGSYRKSGELVKVQVWLIVNNGRIEFLTGKDSYKVRRVPPFFCPFARVGTMLPSVTCRNNGASLTLQFDPSGKLAGCTVA